MKKQFKIHKKNLNFFSFILIENDKIISETLFPDYKENRESVFNYYKKRGYKPYEKVDNSN